MAEQSSTGRAQNGSWTDDAAAAAAPAPAPAGAKTKWRRAGWGASARILFSSTDSRGLRVVSGWGEGSGDQPYFLPLLFNNNQGQVLIT